MEKRELSKAKQWLIEQCQQINFGRITIRVQSGEPDLSQSYSTLRTVKLSGGENGPRPELAQANFPLCREQVGMLAQLAGLDDQASVTIEIKHGLPFLLEVQQDHRAA